MVTEKEFLDAVEVINTYNKQMQGILGTITNIKQNKTPVEFFLQRVVIEDVRVYNALKALSDFYIEDIKKYDFLKLQHVGIKSWRIFEDIRVDYLYKKDK